MPRAVTLAVLSLLVWGLFLAIPALAANSTILAEYRDRVQSKATDLAASRSVLETKSQDEWTIVEVQTYLLDANWAVYDGLLLYTYKNRRMPDAVEDLRGTEYVPLWPGNPFASWEPMEILGVADGFSAGNLVLQVCPPEFDSVMNNPRPLSYELGVYGPNQEFASLGNAHPLDKNSWAVVPTGVYELMGAFTESAASMRLKWEKMQRESSQGASE